MVQAAKPKFRDCVAKTGDGLVKVAIVPAVSRPTDPVDEPQAPL